MMQLTECNGTTTSDTQPRKKYDNNKSGWYFQFADDNNMNYKHIFSIT